MRWASDELELKRGLLPGRQMSRHPNGVTSGGGDGGHGGHATGLGAEDEGKKIFTVDSLLRSAVRWCRRLFRLLLRYCDIRQY